MKEKSIFYFGCGATVLLFLFSLTVGQVDISFQSIFSWNEAADEMSQNLIFNYRLPKSIAAVLVGLSLPVAGFLMQELFKNPLAEPSVLGVTSMASLGVAMVVFLFSFLGLDAWMNNPWVISLASLSGSGLALILLLFFGAKVKSSSSLIILGMMLSGLTAAFIGLMQYFSNSEKIKSFLLWGFGSLTGVSWEQLGIFLIFVTFGLIGSAFTLRGLSALLFGERYAQSLGVDLKKLRLLLLVSSALLTAASTAFTGPIAFVGLAVPHICRSVLKTGNFRLLFRWVILSGVFVMLLFSILTDFFPFGTLPINIITSLVGAPIVMSILLNKNYEINA